MALFGDLKSNSAIEDVPIEENEATGVEKRYHNTAYDNRDMRRLGKRQELRRDFAFFSIFGYAVILGNTWEFSLVAGVFSITNGGTAGTIWMFLVTIVGMFFVMLSMAEIASMCPTSGGQFHWVSEFAPPSCQKFLSFAVGWFCVIGWQSAMIGCGFAAAQQIEAIINLADPSYVIKGWHGALLSIAFVVLAILFNTILVRRLPLFQGIIFFLHVFGFVAFVVVLWVLGPRSPAKEVFTTFADNGWNSVGLSCLIGLINPIVTLIGADSSCHLSEELRDAAWVLPRAMVATASVNYFLAFVTTVTFMFVLGDVDAALSSTTGSPYVQVVLNATQSKGATIVLTCIVMILLFGCTINQVTTSSRQLFAFARDGGMPFSHFLSRVRPGWDIPVNALVVTLIVSVCLSLIIIGSPIAYTIIISISLTGLLSSYIIAISCIMWRRFYGDPFPTSRFNLGRFGIVANVIAFCFLCIACIFMFFPTGPKPTAALFNWNVVVYGAIVIFSWSFYYFKARHTYVGPVAIVNKEL